jgi:T5orf172 domain-containing protein
MNYFIQNTTNGEIKIGYSEDVDRRKHELEMEVERQTLSRQERVDARRSRTKGHIYEVDQLQFANPFTPQPEIWPDSPADVLVVLAQVSGDKYQEGELHKMFESHRRHGEWFAPVILDPVIHWVFDWCMSNTGTQNILRKLAYDCLWNWIAEGVRGKKLQGEIVWCGRHYAHGTLREDISGARVLITKECLDDFIQALASLAETSEDVASVPSPEVAPSTLQEKGECLYVSSDLDAIVCDARMPRAFWFRSTSPPCEEATVYAQLTPELYGWFSARLQSMEQFVWRSLDTNTMTDDLLAQARAAAARWASIRTWAYDHWSVDDIRRGQALPARRFPDPPTGEREIRGVLKAIEGAPRRDRQETIPGGAVWDSQAHRWRTSGAKYVPLVS